VTGLARLIEALLFLAPEPVPVDELADALQASEEDVTEALGELRHALGGRGVVLRELGEGFALASHPDEASLNEALQLYREALVHDPRYAPAWSGIADVYVWLGDAYRAPREVFDVTRALRQTGRRVGGNREVSSQPRRLSEGRRLGA